MITSRDIATLLEQRDVSLARAKAQKLMLEEAVSNAMEILEMHCGVILERFADLDKEYVDNLAFFYFNNKLRIPARRTYILLL